MVHASVSSLATGPFASPTLPPWDVVIIREEDNPEGKDHLISVFATTGADGGRGWQCRHPNLGYGDGNHRHRKKKIQDRLHYVTGYALKFEHESSSAGARAAARGLRVTAEDCMGTQSIHVRVSPSSCGSRPPSILVLCWCLQSCADALSGTGDEMMFSS